MTGDPLFDLSQEELRALLRDLREGAMTVGLSRSGVERACGARSPAVWERLRRLETDGVSPVGLAAVVDTVLSRLEAVSAGNSFELVLSGPDVPGAPTRDTEAVVATMIEEARTSILLVGYAIWDGRRLFERLAARMDADPALAVTFCLNIERTERNNNPVDAEVVKKFAADFRQWHWSGRRFPAVFYDPRALAVDPATRARLHAKCVVIDDAQVLLTSANLTAAAQRRNVEAGALFRDPETARRVTAHFQSLIAFQALRRCEICPPA